MDWLVPLIIWGIFYYINRRKIVSGKIYFLFLGCMLLPASLNGSTFIDAWQSSEISFLNILAFSLCLTFGFFPWLVFDKWIANRTFYVPDKSVPALRTIIIILIIGSLYSIYYLTPYAIISVALGAANVRSNLYAGEASILPESIFTTIAVAIAACNIYAILLYFISCLNKNLYKYRIWLVISSFSYLINCFAITARDGLIIVPCFYIVFFIVFKKSLNAKSSKKIFSQIKKVVIIAAVFLTVFSVSRFYEETEDLNDLYSGTIGYVTQQRSVFDTTIKEQDDFWGFECRFPLINRLLGVKEYDVNRRDNSFEWSFGTMYAEFYDAFAWPGLIFMTIAYVMFYSFGMILLVRKRSTFGTFLLFTVFLYISITGMFYTRAGGTVAMNIFFLTLSIIPFFTGNLVKYRIIKLVTNGKLLGNHTAQEHTQSAATLS